MTGASAVLLLSRRRRRGGGTRPPSDHLPSTSSSSSSAATTTTTTTSRRHQRLDYPRHSRNRLSIEDYDDSRWSSSRSVVMGGCISAQIDGDASESPSRSLFNQGTVSNYDAGSRLPNAVLLARERLLQRLGVPTSGSWLDCRGSTSFGVQYDDVWPVNAGDWETTISMEGLSGVSFSVGSPPEANSRPDVQELRKKPPGLTMDGFATLHHEVLMEVQKTGKMAKSSNDCSICLESFVEGSSLVTLPCHHRFHASCLYPWVQTCGECPYCRTAISLTHE